MWGDLIKRLFSACIDYFELKTKIAHYELEKEHLNKLNRLRDEIEDLRNHPSNDNAIAADRLRNAIIEEKAAFERVSTQDSPVKIRDQG